MWSSTMWSKIDGTDSFPHRSLLPARMVLMGGFLPNLPEINILACFPVILYHK